MRVLMIVQQIEERDPARGFTVGWIRALAQQVERLHVITLEMGEADLPANVCVRSMGKERGFGRARELVAFYRALGQAIRGVDVIFSHMVPRYTWLAAPVAMLYRKPQMLWYAHPQTSRELRMALACARWITTSAQDTFPIPSPKVHVMGQGIDTVRFSPGDPPHDDPLLVLAVGRLSPIKSHHTLLEAAALLRGQPGSPPVRFAVAGAVAAPGDEAYLESLLKRRAELDFSEEQFAFLGGKTQDELATLYRRASVVTNLSPVGSFDKAALEAMLTGTPLIVANPAFDGLLGDHRAALRVDGPDDAAGVAARLAGLLALSAGERDAIGRDLRARTAQAHGLDRLMARFAALMQERN